MHEQHKLTSNTITTRCENFREQDPYTIMDSEEIVIVEPTDPDEDRMREQQQQQEQQEQYMKQQKSQAYYKILSDLEAVKSTLERVSHTIDFSENATTATSPDGVHQSTAPSTPSCSIPLVASSEVPRTYDGTKQCIALSHVPILLLQSPALLKTNPAKPISMVNVTESVHPFAKSMLTNCANVNLATQQVMSVSVPVNAPTVQGLNNIISGHNAILIFYKPLPDFPAKPVNLVPDQCGRINSSHSSSADAADGAHNYQNAVPPVPSTTLPNSITEHITQFSSDGLPKCKVAPKRDIVSIPISSPIEPTRLTNGSIELPIGPAGPTDDAKSHTAVPEGFHLHSAKKRKHEHDLREVGHTESFGTSHVFGCQQNIVSSNDIKNSKNETISITLDISPTCGDEKHSQPASAEKLFANPLDSTSSSLTQLIKTEGKSPTAVSDDTVESDTNILNHTYNTTVPSKRTLPVIAPKMSAQPVTRPWSPIYLNPGVPRPHRCPVEECGMAFAKLGRLRDHIYRHFAKRPFICDQCPASFVRMYDLRRHSKTHV
ncbi:Zinc finger protein [Fasciola hepatica]|uniref:Zinc finger protein n=1 Tax=Fasciola hepatica TaxID=6192 RepID=A0A4E0RY67_FASHE|nr:Zinc finger protein [Fasciola hepatica]